MHTLTTCQTKDAPQTDAATWHNFGLYLAQERQRTSLGLLITDRLCLEILTHGQLIEKSMKEIWRSCQHLSYGQHPTAKGRWECRALNEMSWKERGQGDRDHAGWSTWVWSEPDSRPSHGPGFSITEITQAWLGKQLTKTSSDVVIVTHQPTQKALNPVFHPTQSQRGSNLAVRALNHLPGWCSNRTLHPSQTQGWSRSTTNPPMLPEDVQE